MSRQFDEHVEAESEKAQHLAIAEALGVDPDELSDYEYEAEPHESDDGLLYGYNITFSGDVPKTLEDRLTGGPGARWIRIGPL